MTVLELIREAESTPGCEARAPRGLPRVSGSHRLPGDVQDFYRECGGLDLYMGADYTISIVTPEEFVPANPVLLGREHEDDRSADWYIVARGDDQVITIDLNPMRFGRCYDSFHETLLVC